MIIKVDCVLSKRFGVVERTIFRLVLNGYTDTREIGFALSLFSSPVIANGIRNLVNSQILTVDMPSGRLCVTEPLVALLNTCMERGLELDVSESLAASIKDGGIMLDSWSCEESRQLKIALLESLLPEVSLGLFTDSLDFVLAEAEGGE